MLIGQQKCDGGAAADGGGAALGDAGAAAVGDSGLLGTPRAAGDPPSRGDDAAVSSPALLRRKSALMARGEAKKWPKWRTAQRAYFLAAPGPSTWRMRTRGLRRSTPSTRGRS